MSGPAQGYIGRNPGDSQVHIARQQFTPTGVTTDFTFTSGYTAGYVDVYINGAKILVGRDYTATNGSVVGLTSAAQNGDIVEIVAYKAFNVSNVSESNGNFTVGGILTVDDNTALSGQLEVTGVSTFAGAVENVVSAGIVTALGFSGNITGAAATFTGDVSIGGTLTYEDVTNIDSVGIVTARAGVNVSGGQLLVGTGVTIAVAGVATFRSGRVDVSDALDNTSIGYLAGDAYTTGAGNIAIGHHALRVNTGSSNTALGYESGKSITTGSTNVIIGEQCAASSSITDGASNILLGCNYNPGNQSNLVAFNNASQVISCSAGASSWSFSSDGRDKTDIIDLSLGLGFINKLTPRKFRWDYRDKSRFPVDSKEKPEILIQSGFIAQEVQEVLKEENAEYTAIVNDNDLDALEVSSTGMIPMLVKAVQELSAKNDELAAEIASLKSQINN